MAESLAGAADEERAVARETRTSVDDGSREPELEFTRERLDGTPLTGWRAALARRAERFGAWFGAVATPETSDGDALQGAPAFAGG